MHWIESDPRLPLGVGLGLHIVNSVASKTNQLAEPALAGDVTAPHSVRKRGQLSVLRPCVELLLTGLSKKAIDLLPFSPY